MSLGETFRRRLDPAGRYGLRLTLFAVAFILVALPFGLLVAQVRGDGRLVDLDTAGLERLHEWVRVSPWVVGPLKFVTNLGGTVWLWFVTVATAAFLLRAGRTRLAIFLIVTAALGGLLDTVMKIVIDRPRPILLEPVASARGKSFPSGHAMSSTVIYGALLLIFLPAVVRRWRPVVLVSTVCLVLAIAFTRLALGVHFLSDVVGGIVLGLAWLALSTAAFSIWRVERGRAPVAPMEGLEPEAAPDLPGPVGAVGELAEKKSPHS